jgi:hypothetical protein
MHIHIELDDNGRLRGIASTGLTSGLTADLTSAEAPLADAAAAGTNGGEAEPAAAQVMDTQLASIAAADDAGPPAVTMDHPLAPPPPVSAAPATPEAAETEAAAATVLNGGPAPAFD